MAAPQRTKTLIYSTWRVEKTAHTRGCIQKVTHLCWLVTEPRTPAADTVKVNTCPLMLHYIKIYTNIHVCVLLQRTHLTHNSHTHANWFSSGSTLLLHQILKMLLFNSVGFYWSVLFKRRQRSSWFMIHEHQFWKPSTDWAHRVDPCPLFIHVFEAIL